MKLNASGRIPESGISITLTIVGWLSIAVGCPAVIVWIVAESTTADGGSAMEFSAAVAGLISGVLFIALGAIVQRLHEIEHHLRPAATSDANALASVMIPEGYVRVGETPEEWFRKVDARVDTWLGVDGTAHSAEICSGHPCSDIPVRGERRIILRKG